MSKLAFVARFEAKPGKEEEVANFLEAALEMARKEPTTINWYSFRLSHSTFGVFDTFNDEAGRQKHLNGPIPGAHGKSAGIVFNSTLDRASRLARIEKCGVNAGRRGGARVVGHSVNWSTETRRTRHSNPPFGMSRCHYQSGRNEMRL